MNNYIKSDDLCERCKHYVADYIKEEAVHSMTIWETDICPHIKCNTPCPFFVERYEESGG